MPLLEEVGGRVRVEQVIAVFGERVLADPILRQHFRGAPWLEVQRHIVDFLVEVLSGEAIGYRWRDLMLAHGAPVFRESELDLMANHLSVALTLCGVPAQKVDRVLELVTPLRNRIVTSKPPPVRRIWPPPSPAAGNKELVALLVILAILGGAFAWVATVGYASAAL